MRAFFCLLALACASLACRAAPPAYAPFETLRADVARRVAANDFEGLLQEAERFQKSQERLPDGRWKLSTFYRGLREGLTSAAHGEAGWAREKAALAALAAAHPNSSNAWLMLATASAGQGWAVRGNGLAPTVSDADQARFVALLEEARQVLYRHQALLASNPQSYVLRIIIGAGAGDSPAELDTTFAKALRAAPDYQQVWFTRFNYLQPQWGGSIEQMTALVVRSTQYPSAADGTGLTARLLSYAADMGHPNLARQPGVDWAAVKRSYDDVLDRFPVDYNAESFVLQACGKVDKAETAHLIARIGHAMSPADLGDDARLYGLCADWAAGKVPAFYQQDYDTGQKILIQ